MAGVPSARSLVKRRRMVFNALGVGKTLPVALRPSRIIQRRMISQGLLGKSNFWRVVAIVVLLREPIEGIALRKPEKIARYRVPKGRSVRVATIRPTTRRERREMGLSKRQLKQQTFDAAWAELQDPNVRA